MNNSQSNPLARWNFRRFQSMISHDRSARIRSSEKK
jgi:hypothetical protein